jgi:hypothetical protein
VHTTLGFEPRGPFVVPGSQKGGYTNEPSSPGLRRQIFMWSPNSLDCFPCGGDEFDRVGIKFLVFL